jgi:hypothetical protein
VVRLWRTWQGTFSTAKTKPSDRRHILLDTGQRAVRCGQIGVTLPSNDGQIVVNSWSNYPSCVNCCLHSPLFAFITFQTKLTHLKDLKVISYQPLTLTIFTLSSTCQYSTSPPCLILFLISSSIAEVSNTSKVSRSIICRV